MCEFPQLCYDIVYVVAVVVAVAVVSVALIKAGLFCGVSLYLYLLFVDVSNGFT